MRFKNFTPHTINIYNADGTILLFSIPPESKSVRVKEKISLVSNVTVDGASIPVVKKIYEDCEGLPEPEDGVLYIVSLIVLKAAGDRNDLLCPDTGPDSVVRDEDGKIIGVRRFQC